MRPFPTSYPFPRRRRPLDVVVREGQCSKRGVGLRPTPLLKKTCPPPDVHVVMHANRMQGEALRFATGCCARVGAGAVPRATFSCAGIIRRVHGFFANPVGTLPRSEEH